MQIFPKGVGIISYTENFMGVIIESKTVSEMMKMTFDLSWDNIK